MKPLVYVAMAMSVIAWPAYADVTVKMTTKGPALGPGGPAGRGGATSTELPATYYIKGQKARVDTVMAGHEISTILDTAAGQMIALNPETKEATIYDLGKLGEQMQQSVQMGDTKISMTPTGQTKELLGRTCTEYTLSVTMPMTMGGPGGRQGNMGPMTITLGGPVWIAKDAPGTKDFAAFYKAAADSGLFFSPGGRGGRGSAGVNERGMAAMYKAFSEAGGIPYEQQMQVKWEATGPMADMMRGMGQPPPTVTTVTSVSTDPIPDEKFQIPAGYTRKNQ
jgi:hypothetical protein